MGTCFVCPPEDNHVPDEEFLDHLRVLHPEVWGDGPECWPDGAVVVYDTTLEPGDFDGSAPS